MPLKISLKPHERIVVDHAVIVNGETPAKIHIENHVPVLRERDLLRTDQVKTPCQKLYFTIQMMYLDIQNLKAHHDAYWAIVKPLLAASPSMLNQIGAISRHISEGEYYQALKKNKKLISYETELMNKAKKPQAVNA